MKKNPGHLPADAVGKRVRVKLANGMRPVDSWAADGKGGCNWKITGSDFDIAEYEVAQ